MKYLFLYNLYYIAHAISRKEYRKETNTKDTYLLFFSLSLSRYK